MGIWDKRGPPAVCTDVCRRVVCLSVCVFVCVCLRTPRQSPWEKSFRFKLCELKQGFNSQYDPVFPEKWSTLLTVSSCSHLTAASSLTCLFLHLRRCCENVRLSCLDHQKLEREARICRLLKHPNIGECFLPEITSYVRINLYLCVCAPLKNKVI